MTDDAPPPSPAGPARGLAARPRSTPAASSVVARVQPALFLSFFFLALAAGSRERAWSDSATIVEVAENIVAHGSLAAVTRWPAQGPLGREGKPYDVHPFVPTLTQVPGTLVRRLAARLWPTNLDVSRALGCHVGPAATGALCCLLLFGLLRRQGLSSRASLITAAGVGFATSLWVYARSPYSEIAQMTAFTGLVAALCDARRAPDARRGAFVGLWAGLFINTKLVYVLALPGAAVFLAAPLARARARRALGALTRGAALAFTPFVVAMLAYNRARWGSWTNSGYGVSVDTFAERPWIGFWGMFLSPGKSVFLYSPALVLSLWSLPRAWRRARPLLVATVATALPPLFASAALFCWSGDYAWGPRYLMFAVPILAAPGAFVIQDALGAATRARRVLAGATIAAVLTSGVVVQAAGSLFYWDHFIRIAREASSVWLGTPAKVCPPPAPGVPASPTCDLCFEDMHALMWLPPFQPITGNLWLARHVRADDDWTHAAIDAPWARYTKLSIPIADTYRRARFDWWYLDLRTATSAAWLIIFFLAALGVACAWIAARAAVREDVAGSVPDDDTDGPDGRQRSATLGMG